MLRNYFNILVDVTATDKGVIFKNGRFEYHPVKKAIDVKDLTFALNGATTFDDLKHFINYALGIEEHQEFNYFTIDWSHKEYKFMGNQIFVVPEYIYNFMSTGNERNMNMISGSTAIEPFIITSDGMEFTSLATITYNTILENGYWGAFKIEGVVGTMLGKEGEVVPHNYSVEVDMSLLFGKNSKDIDSNLKHINNIFTYDYVQAMRKNPLKDFKEIDGKNGRRKVNRLAQRIYDFTIKQYSISQKENTDNLFFENNLGLKIKDFNYDNPEFVLFRHYDLDLADNEEFKEFLREHVKKEAENSNLEHADVDPDDEDPFSIEEMAKDFYNSLRMQGVATDEIVDKFNETLDDFIKTMKIDDGLGLSKFIKEEATKKLIELMEIEKEELEKDLKAKEEIKKTKDNKNNDDFN
ncbi:Uncharacterised protein [Metamycoplasma cloacale]|uniref:Uncharacterized protein n=1 Tax=Metamycoplasma cloacale TaxID=92401 RepID=A0A2Z4LMG3_9BACT|nr:hypothetical protein [Metamycoplasma cloacale]AWX42985.1 hypothetical protein DK849_02850 [Metamycoplasma cloacale]VEU79191.1 Uncharacterised protein [Metamycoplasma cloacale]